MANLFKTRFVPNPDGTDSARAITNANTVFVHTYVGDDFSGDGTREYPFKSMFKAVQKSGISNIVFRGVINEYFSISSVRLIGDDINQRFLFLNYNPSLYLYEVSDAGCYNMTVDSVNGTANSRCWYRSIIQKYNIGALDRFDYLLVKDIIHGSSDDGRRDHYLHQSTFFGNEITTCTVRNSIQIVEFNYMNSNFGYNLYTIFPSTCIFKYFSTPIIQPIWTNDSKANIQLLRDAYVVAGMPIDDSTSLFVKDSFGNETCRVIKEQKNGGTSANIFNAYNEDGTVQDYSLNPASNNEALYASDLGGYVGCFKPAAKIDLINDLSEAINVNADGTESSEQGLLLMRKMVSGVKSIEFDTTSNQVWNRCTSNTVNIPNGVKYNGSNVNSDDGSAFGYYFGKHQNLMNPLSLLPTDILEPNTIYKVCNLNRDIYSAVVFNGTQYLPDYFFKTGTSVLNFTLLNGDSGTNVKKVLATPLESIEILPYDNMDTPSLDFPRYSAPFFGDVQMLFHKVGVNIDKPVLFSEVENDKISYYDNWAVTNADQEFVTLANDTANYYYKIPVLKFMRVELNAHFNADYDQ